MWENHRDEEERETLKGDPKRRKESAKDPMAEAVRRQRTGKTTATKETKTAETRGELRKGRVEDTPQQKAERSHGGGRKRTRKQHAEDRKETAAREKHRERNKEENQTTADKGQMK